MTRGFVVLFYGAKGVLVLSIEYCYHVFVLPAVL